MKYGSLFTGIGGFDTGFDRAGMQCSWQIERDKDCNRVLNRHWPAVQRGTDVCEVTPERFKRVDVICGGFPCQDVSVAGNRKGLAGERSGLWHEFRRIVAEFTPRIVVVENVPGLYSSNGGRDYLTVIRGLAELGYCVAGALLDSQYFGVPQRRDRVFLVASLRDGRCAEILFEPESVRGDSPPSREAGQGTAYTTAPCLRASGVGSDRIGDTRGQDCVIACAEIAPTLNAHFGTKQGLEDQHINGGAGLFVMSSGQGNAAISTDSAHALDCLHETQIVAFSCKDHGADAGGVSPTLRSTGHDESHMNGGGQVAIAFNATQDPISSQEVFGALSDQGAAVAENMTVRHLTPRECERLQGFPDDWTRWDAADKEISDSARYRMLGNAVTTFPAEWIGKRIVQFT